MPDGGEDAEELDPLVRLLADVLEQRVLVDAENQVVGARRDRAGACRNSARETRPWSYSS